jgi:hypothetical protein
MLLFLSIVYYKVVLKRRFAINLFQYPGKRVMMKQENITVAPIDHIVYRGRYRRTGMPVL